MTEHVTANSVFASMQRFHVNTFTDHTGQCALSITYPIPPVRRINAFSASWIARGILERSVNYPCFQVYHADHDISLDDDEYRHDAIVRVSRIISDLERNRFVNLFGGVRFEVYSGRPEFRQSFPAGEPNRQCLQAIRKHAIEEREHRNTLGTFQDAVVTYIKNARAFQDRCQEGADQQELATSMTLVREALHRQYYLGALISADIARYVAWKTSFHHSKPVQQIRRKSMSDIEHASFPPTFGVHKVRHNNMMPSTKGSRSCEQILDLPQRSYSTGALTKPCWDVPTVETNSSFQIPVPITHKSTINPVPTLSEYSSRRFKKLATSLMAKFYAPITPNSFHSHIEHPWHSLVLVMSRDNLRRRRWHIMRFGKEASLEQLGEAEFSFTDHDEVKLQQVSVALENGLPDQTQGQFQNIAKVLVKQLQVTGYIRPSRMPYMKPAMIDAENAMWFGPQELKEDGPTIATVEMLEREFEDFSKHRSQNYGGLDIGIGSQAACLQALDENAGNASFETGTGSVKTFDEKDVDMLL